MRPEIEVADRIDVWFFSMGAALGREDGAETAEEEEEEEEERRSRVSRTTAVFPTPLPPLSRTGRLTARQVSRSDASLVESVVWTRIVK